MNFRYAIVLCGLSVALLEACSSSGQKVLVAKKIGSLDKTSAQLIGFEAPENARQKALNLYQDILDKNLQNSETRPEILRRIADLQLELGESVTALPEEQDEGIEVGGVQSAQAEKYYSTAIGYYHQLLTEYPEDSVVPGVFIS